MSRVSIRPQARIELLEAADWYETRSDNLSSAFLRAFDATLANIVRYPRGYQEISGSIRRALLRRFPYAIMFVLEGEDVVILACMHTSRDPSRWQGRS